MRKTLTSLILLFFSSLAIFAQSPAKKYPALLWEITGNGLQKPSYLFGTMHVSNKLAFHLSDSFYYALKSVDAVALEVNPELWQQQMIRLNKLNDNYSSYSRAAGNEYLVQKSFRLTDFSKELQQALGSEPPVVNSLLYRSYSDKQDFEEDTFLDLYIFQSGRKLGKQAAGVEDYYESEKMVLEAYMDMAREKSKPLQDLSGETINSLTDKLENSYRRGDLDLLDSLNGLMETSKAFTEKFLYQRNDIQAKSIDSIVKKISLFVGVGAAHLPGPRGVIAQLQAMGYTLRPIKMIDRDAAQKELLEEMHVPVNFIKQTAPDKAFTVQVPGTLYSLQNSRELLNRWQFADMNNGSYYMVTRVKTFASFLGMTQKQVLSKTDSLLYENIPGKILSKKEIVKNGIQGWDIQNRTRTGNLQRYQIFVNPFEIIVFKMSGQQDYVKGKEAETYFNSIVLNSNRLNSAMKVNGMSLNFDGEIHESNVGTDPDRFEYSIKNKDEAYLVLREQVNNFNFIAEDSFAITMMQESFRNPDLFGENIFLKRREFQNQKALFSIDKLKDSGQVLSVFFMKGADYFSLSRRSFNLKDTSFAFIDNVKVNDYDFGQPQVYIDPYLKFKVVTPVKPTLDEGIRNLVEESLQDINNGKNKMGVINYWNAPRNAMFKDVASGELVGVMVQNYPKYYSIKDTSRFWRELIESYTNKDLVLSTKKLISNKGNAYGYYLSFTDTGSVNHINRLVLLQNDRFYSVTSTGESDEPEGKFKKSFYDSFQPYNTDSSFDYMKNKTDLFFADYYNPDSATHELAVQSIQNVNFIAQDAPKIVEAVQGLSINDRDYFKIKNKFINQLGYINEGDRTAIPILLQDLYNQTADTVLFQNEILTALARSKTKKSFSTLLNIMLQDPPVFDYDQGYFDIFNDFSDTLELTRHFIKQLLSLTSINDYKGPVNELLVSLVDSGLVNRKDYKKYFTPVYLDARIALKKQSVKDEEKMQDELVALHKPEEADAKNDDYDSDTYDNAYGLYDYAVLLMPFYEKEKKVQVLFDKIMQTKNDALLLSTAVLLVNNNKNVDQNVWAKIASNEKYAGKLYSSLKAKKLLNVYPKIYRDQEYLAKSFMLQQSTYKKLDSVVLIGMDTATYRNKTGRVYYYKYRVKPTDEWKIAIAGLQPFDASQVWDDVDFNSLTEKRLLEYEPSLPQLKAQLKRLTYSTKRAGMYFFSEEQQADNYDY